MEAHDGRKLANFEKTGKWTVLTMENQAMKRAMAPDPTTTPILPAVMPLLSWAFTATRNRHRQAG